MMGPSLMKYLLRSMSVVVLNPSPNWSRPALNSPRLAISPASFFRGICTGRVDSRVGAGSTGEGPTFLVTAGMSSLRRVVLANDRPHLLAAERPCQAVRLKPIDALNLLHQARVGEQV